MSWRYRIAALVGTLSVPASLPATASAHGLTGRADLPIPQWMFGWAAAGVLILSFVGLAALWQRPRLEQPRTRALFRVPRWIEPLCGALGLLFFIAVVYSGFAGTRTATANLAPTAVYVLFWVGPVVLSILCGNVFRLFNPWLFLARAAAWVTRHAAPGFFKGQAEPLPYPQRLGRWPAVVGIFCFAWLELVYLNKTDPSLLAALALLYAAAQLIAMSIYGIDAWSERGDAFGVYFGLFARLSCFERRQGVLHLRPPLSGATQLDVRPATVALLCVMIGSTSFDGLSSTSLWTSIEPGLQSFFSSLGAGKELASEAAFTIGLLFMIGLIASVYRLGVAGMRSVGGSPPTDELARQFIHTLIPIAAGYVIAHYFSLLIDQGQATAYLISDPLGVGSNFFGTASAKIDYNVISATGIWYVQVAALVTGHVCGLVLAHDRALTVYKRPDQATQSQYWMLAVMIAFTSLGLWLLSSINA